MLGNWKTAVKRESVSAGSVGATGGFGRRLAAFNGFNDRRQPVGDIHCRSLAGQDVIAQGAQRDGQVVESCLGCRVFFALAMLMNHCDQSIGGGALRVEVVDGWAMEIGVEGIGHGGGIP